MNRTKRFVLLGVLTSLAMILSYLEHLLPSISASFPGIKMGLPNIVIVVALYALGVKAAATISLVRLLLSAVLFGNIMSFWYSLAGAAISLTLMAVLKRFRLFSTVGVSVTGGISHNLGQILVAAIVLQTAQIGYYMIILAVTGTIAGLCVGLAGSYLLRFFEKNKPKMQ